MAENCQRCGFAAFPNFRGGIFSEKCVRTNSRILHKLSQRNLRRGNKLWESLCEDSKTFDSFIEPLPSFRSQTFLKLKLERDGQKTEKVYRNCKFRDSSPRHHFPLTNFEFQNFLKIKIGEGYAAQAQIESAKFILKNLQYNSKNAQVVKLADTQASEACGSNSLEVQILSWAHKSSNEPRGSAGALPWRTRSPIEHFLEFPNEQKIQSGY